MVYLVQTQTDSNGGETISLPVFIYMDAIRDENSITSMLALSFVDGVTVVPIQIDSTNGGVMVDTVNTVSTAAMNAARDENDVTTLMAVDSVSGDPIPVFADPATGAILTD